MNYEEPSAAGLAKKFEIQTPVVVLAKMKGGEIAQWKRLDRVWALVGDKPGYASYLRDEISQMVRAAEPQPTLASPKGKPRRKNPSRRRRTSRNLRPPICRFPSNTHFKEKTR